MSSIPGLKLSPTMQAILAFQDTPAMRAINEIHRLPGMRQIMDLQKLPIMRMTRLLPKFNFADELYSVEGFRKAALILKNSQSSPLVEFLASEHALDIKDYIDVSSEDNDTAGAPLNFRAATKAEIELDRNIVGHLKQQKSIKTLSIEQKSRLGIIIFLIATIANIIALTSTVRQELCFQQAKWAPSLTSGQVGKAVRKLMCEREIPPELMLRIRTVKGHGVRLRTGPGMSEEVLPVILQDRALLEVLDSDNRDWLYVSVLGDQGVDGWISRKYTHR